MTQKVSSDVALAVVSSASFEELAEVAILYLRKLVGDLPAGTRIWQVCGPFTTGRKTQEENVTAFNNAMKEMRMFGHVIFDQFPFEEKILELIQKWRHEGNEGYCTPVLKIFYRKIF